jgi:4-hydroxy-2-oxoheptanedioate aldolase
MVEFVIGIGRRHANSALLVAWAAKPRGRENNVSKIPRLNGAIRAFENNKIAFSAFLPPEIGTLQAAASAPYDTVVIEMEHNPYDASVLRYCLQSMLDRRQIAASGSVAPSVTPMVRLPTNGEEYNQWLAKQALDMGVYGIIWPHIRTVDEARAAVAACRYSRPSTAPHFEPAGRRGDGPGIAARYWGLTQQEYYTRADVWPIDPQGEICVGMMCESMEALHNLPQILKEVKGISLVIIGEGDLSQDLGFPRQYEHPKVVAAMNEILAICNEHDVVCGHPHVDTKNVDGLIDAGYKWLMAAPVRSFAALERGRQRTSVA